MAKKESRKTPAKKAGGATKLAPGKKRAPAAAKKKKKPQAKKPSSKVATKPANAKKASSGSKKKTTATKAKTPAKKQSVKKVVTRSKPKPQKNSLPPQLQKLSDDADRAAFQLKEALRQGGRRLPGLPNPLPSVQAFFTEMERVYQELLDSPAIKRVKMTTFKAATKKTIEAIEEEHEVDLPPDIVDFYLISNGFKLNWTANRVDGFRRPCGGSINILPIEEVFKSWEGHLWWDTASEVAEAMTAPEQYKSLRPIDFFYPEACMCLCVDSCRLVYHYCGEEWTETGGMTFMHYLELLVETRGFWYSLSVYLHQHNHFVLPDCVSGRKPNDDRETEMALDRLLYQLRRSTPADSFELSQPLRDLCFWGPRLFPSSTFSLSRILCTDVLQLLEFRETLHRLVLNLIQQGFALQGIAVEHVPMLDIAGCRRAHELCLKWSGGRPPKVAEYKKALQRLGFDTTVCAGWSAVPVGALPRPSGHWNTLRSVSWQHTVKLSFLSAEDIDALCPDPDDDPPSSDEEGEEEEEEWDEEEEEMEEEEEEDDDE